MTTGILSETRGAEMCAKGAVFGGFGREKGGQKGAFGALEAGKKAFFACGKGKLGVGEGISGQNRTLCHIMPPPGISLWGRSER